MTHPACDRRIRVSLGRVSGNFALDPIATSECGSDTLGAARLVVAVLGVSVVIRDEEDEEDDAEEGSDPRGGHDQSMTHAALDRRIGGAPKSWR